MSLSSTRSSEDTATPRYHDVTNVKSDLPDSKEKSADNLESGKHDGRTTRLASFGEGELENLKIEGGIDPIFEAKASLINAAIQHIGMGKYQWKLFALCGFGWVCVAPTMLNDRQQIIFGYKGSQLFCHK
jgi:hypothetical protein